MTKIKKITLSHSEVKELWNYDENTGLFNWKTPRGSRTKAGMQAGSINKTGYHTVSYKKQKYYLHRLAWFYVHGEDPVDSLVDHVDGNPSNNRISNLRLCTHNENKANITKYANNTSGYKGITWNKQRSKWQAQVHVKGKHYHIGLFDCKEVAHTAYIAFCSDIQGAFYRQ